MNYRKTTLAPGLHLVSTPIGNARDITLRALDTLASADLLAAEDTRMLLKLMNIHGIPLEGRRIHAFHDHSKSADRQRLLDAMLAGQSVAYATDAGTPLIADPGYTLVSEARAKDVAVTAAPGPSALTMALSVAGLPTDRFSFRGFAPPARTARIAFLTELSRVRDTSVFYETPRRIADCLSDARDALGPDRVAVVCRELTKRFEEVRSGTLDDLAEHFGASTPKGELVILLAPAEENAPVEADVDAAIIEALTTMRVKDAADAVAGSLGLPRRDVYQRALRLKSGEAN
ncbi:MAG: 16S rRNA (cytidine(1402)-2'-O)-methyltransferase [Pseudomonadota bacterium]